MRLSGHVRDASGQAVREVQVSITAVLPQSNGSLLVPHDEVVANADGYEQYEN